MQIKLPDSVLLQIGPSVEPVFQPSHSADEFKLHGIALRLRLSDGSTLLSPASSGEFTTIPASAGGARPIHMGGLNVSLQTENWEVRTEEFQHGSTRVQRSTIRTPDGTLTQDLSTNEVRPGWVAALREVTEVALGGTRWRSPRQIDNLSMH